MIALFQDQIAEHQSLAEHYRELAAQREKLAESLLAIEQEASGVFQSLANITKKIQDSKAIATLKFALLDLFDGRGGDGGNQPTDPTPNPDPTNPAGGDGQEKETAGAVDCGLCGADLQSEGNYPEFAPAAIAGICRSCEAKLIEAEKEAGIAGDEDTEDSQDELIFHSDNKQVAWIPGENGKLSAFVGFEKKSIATSWFDFLQPAFEGIELGASAVMESYRYELRCYGLSMAQISKLSECDFSKSYHTNGGETQPTQSTLIYHPENKALMYLCFPDGKVSAWIGFEKKQIAKSWQKFIEPMALSTELMVGDAFKWQIFAKGLSMSQVSKLAQQDFTKAHLAGAAEIGTATPPESKKKFVGKTVKVGDRVVRLLTPSEVFEVTSVGLDGAFFAKSVLNGDRQLFSLEDVNVLSSLPEGAPKYATVLLSGDEYLGQKLPIFDQSDSYLTLELPNGEKVAYKRDVIQIVDEQIEEIADPTQPTDPAELVLAAGIQVGDRVKLSSPCSEAYREFEGMEMEVVRFVRADLVNCLLPNGDWHPFALSALCLASVERQEPTPDTHSILGVGDIVQIISDRYPQYFNHVGTVEEILQANPDTPIQVRALRGAKLYRRSELKLISKALPFAEEKKELVGATADFDDF